MRYSMVLVQYLLLAMVVLALIAMPTYAKSLLVSSNGTDQILQYNLETGAFEKVFADASTLGSATIGGNLLDEPTGMDIGPDGNVYVAYRDGLNDTTTGGILRFKPDGTFIDVFSTAVPSIQDLDFGPDGNIYANQYSSGVSCILGPNSVNAGELDPTHTPIGSVYALEPYDNPITGEVCYFRSISASGGQVRLSNKSSTTLAILTGSFTSTNELPLGLEFGPDGLLYCVTYNNSDLTNMGIYSIDVSTIDYSSGEGTGTFTKIGMTAAADPDVNQPLGIAFDDNGNVLVCNYDNCVARFGTDGTYIDNLVGVSEGGLYRPHYGLVVLPETVPEPSTVLLLATGFLGLLIWRRK